MFFSSSEAFIPFPCNANIKWIASFVINAFLKEVTQHNFYIFIFITAQQNRRISFQVKGNLIWLLLFTREDTEAQESWPTCCLVLSSLAGLVLELCSHALHSLALLHFTDKQAQEQQKPLQAKMEFLSLSVPSFQKFTPEPKFLFQKEKNFSKNHIWASYIGKIHQQTTCFHDLLGVRTKLSRK